VSDTDMVRLGAAGLVIDHATALARRGRLDEAALLLQPIAADPKVGANVLDLLARIRAQQGRLEDAQMLWLAALEKAPGEPRIKRALERCGRLRGSRPRLGRVRLARWPDAALVWVLALACVLVLGLASWNARSTRATLTAQVARLEEQLASRRQGLLDESGLADLRAAVEAVLAERPGAGGVEARVTDDGVIRLSGEIASLWEAYTLESAAADLPGVTALDITGLRLAADYEVQPGDCLSAIAARVYGAPSLWPRLAEVNNLAPPYLLHPGDRLIVPDIDRTEGRGGGG